MCSDLCASLPLALLQSALAATVSFWPLEDHVLSHIQPKANESNEEKTMKCECEYGLEKISNKCGSERMRMRKYFGENSGFPYANQLWKISYLLYEMGPSLSAFVKHLDIYGISNIIYIY